MWVRSNLGSAASAMIWSAHRELVPDTIAYIPLPLVSSGWSTPGTLIAWPKSWRSAQY